MSGAKNSAQEIVRSLRRCGDFLDRRARLRWLSLVPMALLAALLEAVGAALVFSLIKLITNPDRPDRLADAVRGLAPQLPDQTFFVAYCAVVAAFYVLKNAALITNVYVANRVAWQTVVTTAQRLLQAYLQAGIAFHFDRNSGELIRNINGSVDNAFRTTLVGAVLVASEALLVLAVVLVLVSAAPGVTAAIGAVMAILLALLLLFTQRRFAAWGAQVHDLNGRILQQLQDAFNAIVPISISGRDGYFVDRFGESRSQLSRVVWHRNTLQAAPRLFVETIFVLGVVSLIVLARESEAGQEVIPLLGLLAYAGFRILPSVHRMATHLNQVRHGVPAIEELHRDWTALTADHPDDDPDDEARRLSQQIELTGVTYRYPGASRPALHAVNLTVRQGETLAVVGATGSGKSTLIAVLLGLLEPTEGAVLVDGANIDDDRRGWQRQIGYVPQDVIILDDTLRRNVAFGVIDEDIDDARVRHAVKLAQLATCVDSLESGLDTPLGEGGGSLSGGERQRVGVARALYHQPSVLVFDEATSAIDADTEEALNDAIAALHGDSTMIVVTHRPESAARCDRQVRLQDGRLVD